ncbi:MAG: UDP-N-acetylglucosamine 2-epimerase [Candidatus Woesearchaeota archaeon]|jgi:UDP-N-acetylglucosamine 2-epimerase (non-hydrolysing)
MKEINTNPTYLPITLHEEIIQKTMKEAVEKKQWVLIFVIGTKPCFYKFYGSVIEAEKAGIPHIILNSNQHYDGSLIYGKKELNYAGKIGVDFNIRGDLAQKSAELFTKTAWLAKYLKEKWPTVTAMPVVLGDTILTATVSTAWMFSRQEKAIHNEAGLRSMSPAVMKEALTIDTETFIQRQFTDPWHLQTNEPFPEQWDTYVASKSCEFLFAPLELNKQHLLREGHPENKMWTTGGVVVEALEAKKHETPTKSIFEIYPQLEKEQWIRVDIHRKENQIKGRTEAIIKGIKELVEKGHNICFIEMNTTKESVEKYNLMPIIDKLKKHKNFMYTPLWPEFANVLEFYQSQHCHAALTDSGGVQEDMNLLHKPCITVRFNTDRPETIMNIKNNILVPPITGPFFAKTVSAICSNDTLLKEMTKQPSLYGEKVAEKFINLIKKLMESGRRPMSWAHNDLGYNIEE